MLSGVRGQQVSWPRDSTALRWGAVAVVAAALLPLIGLMLAWLDPPAAPFAERPSLGGLLLEPRTLDLLFRTLALGATVGALVLPLGFWLAWAERRCDHKAVRWLALGTLLPLAVPSYILAATLRESLGPSGWLPAWLAPQSFTGFWPAVLALTLVTLPYAQLLAGAALLRLSGSEIDALRLLNGRPLDLLRVVLWPRLRVSLGHTLLIVALYVISDFGAVAILDVQVLTWRLYQAVDHQQLAEAAALGAVLILAAAPLFAGSRWLRGRHEQRQGVANPRQAVRTRFSRPLLWFTLALQLTVITLGVLLPVATLIDWTWGGLQSGQRFAALGGPIGDTLRVTLLATGLIVLAASVPARLAHRLTGRSARWLDDAVYLGSAVPGVLLAFGLLLVALAAGRMVPIDGFYGLLISSGILLVMGYLMRFLAEAFASLRSALGLLDPRLTDSARVLGVSQARFRRQVALPLLAPGIAASAMLVWLSLLKELPVTLLLGGAMGLDTLAFRIFDRYEEALLHDAGAAGLMLLGLAIVATLITLPWRRHA